MRKLGVYCDGFDDEILNHLLGVVDRLEAVGKTDSGVFVQFDRSVVGEDDVVSRGTKDRVVFVRPDHVSWLVV